MSSRLSGLSYWHWPLGSQRQEQLQHEYPVISIPKAFKLLVLMSPFFALNIFGIRVQNLWGCGNQGRAHHDLPFWHGASWGPELRIDEVANTRHGHIVTSRAYEFLRFLNYLSDRQHFWHGPSLGFGFRINGVVETRHGCIMTPRAKQAGLLSTHYMVKHWGHGDQEQAHHDSLGHTQLLHRPGECQQAGTVESHQTWLCPCTNRWAYIPIAW